MKVKPSKIQKQPSLVLIDKIRQSRVNRLSDPEPQLAKKGSHLNFMEIASFKQLIYFDLFPVESFYYIVVIDGFLAKYFI